MSELTRRELLGTMARWTVPTVVTIALGASPLEAAPSCPPCSKKNAGKCKACSVSQILNCQCEPCLGAPYCSSGAPSPPAFGQSGYSGPSGSQPAGTSPGLPGGPLGGAEQRDERLRGGTMRGPAGSEPISGSLYQSPFSDGSRYRGLGRSPFDNSGLYGRLRGDTATTRRRP